MRLTVGVRRSRGFPEDLKVGVGLGPREDEVRWVLNKYRGAEL